MKRIIYISKIIAILGILSTSCQDDREVVPPGPDTPQQTAVTFTAMLPGASQMLTRAVDEEDITELDILVFQYDAVSSTEIFVSTVPATNIQRTAAGSRFYTFSAALPFGTGYSLVLLANSRNVVTGNPLLTAGNTRGQITEGLLLTTSGKWDTQTPEPIPMWAEINNAVITATSTFTGIKLIRMLAKINISVHPDQPNSTHQKSEPFILKNVYLYNMVSNGRVIPNTTHYNTTTNAFTEPTLPSLPTRHTPALQYPAEQPPALNRVSEEIYLCETDSSSGAETSTKPFLVVEGSFGNMDDQFYRIDLVVQQTNTQGEIEDLYLPLIRNHTYNIVITDVYGRGYSSLDDAASTKPVNMAVQVFEFNDGETRNVIFDGQYHMAVSHEIMNLDKAERTSVSTDNVLSIQTNNHLGWTAEIVPGQGGTIPTWITLSDNATVGGTTVSGPGGEGVAATDIHVNVQEFPNGSAPRTANIRITAGRLVFELEVTQSHLEALTLVITDPQGNEINELYFRSNPTNSALVLSDLNFKVKWSPSPCAINVKMLGDKLFEFGSSGIDNGNTLNDPTGERDFTITPTPFQLAEIDAQTGNPFMEKSAMVQFSVTNGTETITRNLYVRHQCISLLFDNFRPLCYMGKSYSFQTRSNFTWRISSITEEVDGLISTRNFNINQTGGNDTKTGDNFTYTMKPAAPSTIQGIYGLGEAGRKINITFTDPAGILPDVVKTITAITPDPNCYFGPPGSSPILIPIRKLFWLWEEEMKEPVSLNITPQVQLIWDTDSVQRNQNLHIQWYNNSTDPRDALISVTPHTAGRDGNFVIGILEPGYTNQYLWSWHIWGTNYNPDVTPGGIFTNQWYHLAQKPEFMTRNLGATTNEQNAITETNAGLYYQWGRKDPFPGGNQAAINALTNDYNGAGLGFGAAGTWRRRRLSNAAGNFIQVNHAAATTRSLFNLPNAVRNPFTFYMCGPAGSGDCGDWYTNSPLREYQNDYLWQDIDNRKGYYDPCPHGWRLPFTPDVNTSYNHSYRGLVEITEQTASATTYFPGQRAYVGDHSSGTTMMIPGGGAYQGSIASIQQVKGSCTLFTATRSAHNGLQFSVYSYQGVISVANSMLSNRAGACPVRCIRDTEPWY